MLFFLGITLIILYKISARIKLEKLLALHEFLWDGYLKLSLIFNWNAPSDPRCEDFFAGIVLAAIERASLG